MTWWEEANVSISQSLVNVETSVMNVAALLYWKCSVIWSKVVSPPLGLTECCLAEKQSCPTLLCLNVSQLFLYAWHDFFEHVNQHLAHLAKHKYIISTELMGIWLDLDGHFSRWPMYPIPLASVIISHFFYGPFP